MSPASWPRGWRNLSLPLFSPFSLPVSRHQGLGGGMGERKHIQRVGVIIIQPTWQEQDADPPSGTSVGSLGTPKHSVCLASCDLPASPPHLLLLNLHPTDSNSWGVVSPADRLQEWYPRRMAPALPPLPSSVSLSPQGRSHPHCIRQGPGRTAVTMSPKMQQHTLDRRSSLF